MSNPWFRFKQFTVMQDACAMKVTTDACIQGAWTPIPAGNVHVLDVGAGTGLLSLMLAQRNPDLLIDAVELETSCAAQGAANVAASPWKESITVHNCDIKQFGADRQYDVIICNPPFFSNSLLSGRKAKNQARHDVSLTQTDLADIIQKHLAPSGICSILLPYAEYTRWLETAKTFGLHELTALCVRHRPGGRINRMVGILSKHAGKASLTEELVIKDEDGGYSAAFRKLLRPFYLDI